MVGARRAVPPRSLPTIIGAFKSAVTKRINRLRNTPGVPVWQRNYFGKSTATAVLLHIIRNERDLERIRAYIAANPAR